MSLILPPSSDGGLTVDVTIAAQDAPVETTFVGQTTDVNVNIAAQDAPIDINIVGQTDDVLVQVTNQYVPLVEIPRGNVSGATQIAGFGELTTSGSVTNSVIWGNGVYTLPPAAGVQMSVVSSSANDAAAGTGVRTLRIVYLDANLVQQVETVTLNGTTPVTTVATNIRFIIKLIGITYGSLKAAGGNISVSHSGTTYGYLPTGFIVDSTAVYMPPAGKRLMITGLSAGSSSGSAVAKVIVHIAVSKYGDVDYSADSIFVPIAGVALQDNSESMSLPVPFEISAGTAFCMLATTDKAATIVGSWFGWLEST
jgi:hypothetical protein